MAAKRMTLRERDMIAARDAAIAARARREALAEVARELQERADVAIPRRVKDLLEAWARHFSALASAPKGE